jgi:hypothetical protein
MESPKNPLLSTFWLTTTKDFKINRIDFKDDTIKIQRSIKNGLEALPTCKGKKIKILYAVANSQTTPVREVSGILQEYFNETSTLKINTTDGYTLFLTTNQILELYIEGKTEDKFKADSLTRVGLVSFNKSGEVPLKLTYMSTGMQWIPSYNIKLIDDKTLQIEMKALVENFSESLKNVDLTLTVGAPQFKYGTQVDYFALNYYTGTSSTYNYKNYNTYLYSNSIQTMSAKAPMMEEADANYDWNNYESYSTAGEKSNDLYKYRIGKVNLPMNTKSSFSIFSASIPYTNIYEVNVGDVVSFANTRQIINNPEQRFDVYHSLKLHNTTGNPFTTAPVFVQDEKLEPLAQDEIKYTPIGGNCKVQLSRSPDVYVSNTEEQVKKDDNAKTYNKVVYSKVTIKGTIPIENLQDKSITLNVSKYITGTIISVSDDGKINVPGKYNGLNPASNAEWTINLKANEKKTITYTYEVYVYNY